MGLRVIRQPDGQLAVFSSYCDQLIAVDMSEKDIEEMWVENAREEAIRIAKEEIKLAKEGGRLRDWRECVGRHLVYSGNSDLKWNREVCDVLDRLGPVSPPLKFSTAESIVAEVLKSGPLAVEEITAALRDAKFRFEDDNKEMQEWFVDHVLDWMVVKKIVVKDKKKWRLV